ncbi:MAG: hypothetical protein IPH07_16230 [Deltaproteobacteria bacterium]|nr:hypothetical protein [Deltaproteobacteria bacterium]MBK8239322.1 hypothetical protein [Deltaproteobacteria bacterium]MBK8719600.1 hypothetical protein [Deltaproteobacteria bacterium]MBP7290890.1 hypothetical protein [Nannocystaceae bacterium]
MRAATRLCLPLLTLALSLVAVPGDADARSTRRGPVQVEPPVHTGVHVSIEAPEGSGFTTVGHRGQTFVAGELGERYVVRIVNDAPTRVEVVVSVDGRDVISGKLGDFRKQRGYVVEPFGEVVIDGFRRSLSEVASFRFSGVGDSYTARRGTPQHAGVIGVAVFGERASAVTRPWAATDSARADKDTARRDVAPRTSPAPDRGAGSARSKSPRAQRELGTEFGEDRFSPVVEVPFTRRNASTPDQKLTVFYDSAAGLRARGVPIDPVFVDGWRGDPQPWPSADREGRFAPPPPPRRWE